jgi:multidrug efflux pump subunit AcrA (membrane-fusion protein)
VRTGDLLVKVDDREIMAGISGLQARLISARAQAGYAKKQYDRDRSLFKAGGLAREKEEASRVAHVSAAAAVTDLEQKIKSMQTQLEYLQIKAPFDGIVGTILLHPGDLAAPGRSLLTLNSLTQKLTFSFPPGSEEPAIGQQVLFEDGTAAGKVSNLYNDAKNGLSVAEVLPDAPISQPVNSFLMISVVRKTVSGCAVPVRSLLHRAAGTSVMVYRDKRFTETPVAVSAQDDGFAVLTPCPGGPVAVAAEAKLSLLPTYGSIRIIAGESNE